MRLVKADVVLAHPWSRIGCQTFPQSQLLANPVVWRISHLDVTTRLAEVSDVRERFGLRGVAVDLACPTVRRTDADRLWWNRGLSRLISRGFVLFRVCDRLLSLCYRDTVGSTALSPFARHLIDYLLNGCDGNGSVLRATAAGTAPSRGADRSTWKDLSVSPIAAIETSPELHAMMSEESD